jgi:uridine kinase
MLQVLSEKQHDLAAKNEYNFDHPDAFDFELMSTTLQRLKEGRKVEVPIYNFVTHSRESRTVRILQTVEHVLKLTFFQMCTVKYR